jgi:hypothetical protein
MLDRGERGTGSGRSDGWIRSLVSDRVGTVASLLVLGREIDDESRVLESALCLADFTHLHWISPSLLQRRKDISSLLDRGHGLKRDSGVANDLFECIVE